MLKCIISFVYLNKRKLFFDLISSETREEQRMEASCVTTAPVFTLVTLARTRALAGEQTLGPLTQKQFLFF